MALVDFGGWETGSLTGGEIAGSDGTVSIVTSPVRTGTYALHVNPTTTAVGDAYVRGPLSTTGTLLGTYDVTTSYITFYFRYATKPASASEEILSVWDNSIVRKGSLRLNTAGTLSIYDQTGTNVKGTSSTALSADTWYRIDFKIGTSASVAVYELKINGSSEISGSDMDALATPARYIYFGKQVDRNSQTIDVFYDDWFWDDAAYVAAGSFKVLGSPPIANGSTQAWTAGTTGTYADIDEIPYSDSDYVQSPTTGNPNVALFTFNTCATMGLGGSDTVKGVRFSGRRRENSSVTSADFVRMKSSSTNADSSTRNLSTTAETFAWVRENDPATSAAWAQSAVNAVEGGLVENNAVAIRLTSIILQVAYVEAAGASGAVTGTATASITEADIVTGGKTIILTLTGDTWIAAGAGSFDLIRQDIINGLDSAQGETFGWNNIVQGLQAVTGVVRTSDTVVTITLDAQITYNITAQETITVTVPASAVTGATPISATPTFTVDIVSSGNPYYYYAQLQ